MRAVPLFRRERYVCCDVAVDAGSAEGGLDAHDNLDVSVGRCACGLGSGACAAIRAGLSGVPAAMAARRRQHYRLQLRVLGAVPGDGLWTARDMPAQSLCRAAAAE